MQKCPICESAFTDKSQMRRHKERVHEGKKPYKCSMCDAGYFVSSSLKKHIKRAHERGENKVFKCPICAVYMKTKQSLEKHILTVHEGKKPFKCDLCLKNFGQNDWHHLKLEMWMFVF